ASLTVQTPLAECPGHVIAERVGLMPILRAGLGMAEAILEIVPAARVWHLGIYRDHETVQPVTYYNKLPPAPDVDVALVVDAMLATGGSAVAAVSILKRWGAPRIKFLGLIAAPEGVQALRQAHPDVPIHLAALDSHLDERCYIVPGLGDAGDRLFGTGWTGGAASDGPAAACRSARSSAKSALSSHAARSSIGSMCTATSMPGSAA